MISKLSFLLCLVLATTQGLSQVSDIEKEAWKSYQNYSKGRNRLVTNKSVVPNEFYFYKKNTNSLHTIMLMYPHRKLYHFWIVEDKLVGIDSQQLPTKTSKRQMNEYIFVNDSLVYQRENYKDSLNVDDLKKTYKAYKTKAVTQ